MKWYWSNGCDILLRLQEARRFLAPKLRQKNGRLGSKLSQRGLKNPKSMMMLRSSACVWYGSAFTGIDGPPEVTSTMSKREKSAFLRDPKTAAKKASNASLLSNTDDFAAEVHARSFVFA